MFKRREKKEKKEKPTSLQRWQVYLMLGVLLVAMILYVVQKIRGVDQFQTGDEEIACALAGGLWDYEQDVCSVP